MDELVVGTYEGFLLGYSIRTEDSIMKLKQTFAIKSHTASVRCASTGGKFLASGGTDDKVVVIDMKNRKEHTVLFNHSGPVNSVAFTHSGTHLLTGGHDGSIVVTRTGNWKIEKMWKSAHGGQPVIAIAVHPSDKLALSIGGDKTLRTWNLIKGRPAFTINLASKGIVMSTEINFSPGGDRFSLVSQLKVDIWTIKAELEKRITCTSNPTTVQWLTDEILCVGLANGNIITLSVSDTEALTYQAHKLRVKTLSYENELLYSASSSGELKVWSVDNSKLVELCSCNAACRLMCATLNRQSHLIKKEEHNSDKTEDKQEATSEENDDSDEAEEVTSPPKRKPGAFVSISYGDEEDNKKVNEGRDNQKRKVERGDDNESIHPPKKSKRKRNKKPKIHKNGQE